MLDYRTEGYNGCAVKYSPFFDSRLAVAASANFGLVGNGRFYIFDLTPQGIVPLKWYFYFDILFLYSPFYLIKRTSIHMIWELTICCWSDF